MVFAHVFYLPPITEQILIYILPKKSEIIENLAINIKHKDEKL